MYFTTKNLRGVYDLFYARIKNTRYSRRISRHHRRFYRWFKIQRQMKRNVSSELSAALEESEAMLNDPNTKKFDSVDALFADLDAED